MRYFYKQRLRSADMIEQNDLSDTTGMRVGEVAKDRMIKVDPGTHKHTFSTDETLMMRVIGNMTKNALEAIRPEESVTLSCRKGDGRGLGTYSIKVSWSENKF